MATADTPSLPKLGIEKFADGRIACLKFTGTIDEAFEGGKLGASVGKVDMLVLDLGGVRKISSFGIREWVDFVTAAAKQASELVLIECSPKVVDQLNMVANFTGGGRVFSFYAPFRCDYCDSEQRVLLDVAKDIDAIKAMKLADRRCLSCKETMYFDDDGATFFSYVAGQGAFELDPATIAFLAAKLDYRAGAVDQKIRVDKVIEGRVTYVRLAGALDQTFPRDKLADGLEGTAILDIAAVPRVEPAGGAEWRGLVQQVTPLVERFLIIGATPAFLERLAGPSDLGVKGAVVDCSLSFACPACGTTTTQAVPAGNIPEVHCASCKAVATCTAPEPVLAVVRRLPRVELGKDLDRQIAALRSRRLDKKPSTGIGALPRPVEKRGSALPYVAGVLVLAAAASGVIYYLHSQKKDDPGPFGLGPVVESSASGRPAWLAPGEHVPAWPGRSFCTERNGALTCVGISALAASAEEAEDDASDSTSAALAVALMSRTRSVTWLGLVKPYADAADARVAALERDPKSTQARRDVRASRRAVARILRATDSTPLARYWEAFDTGGGRRFVAFASESLSAPAVAALVDSYQKVVVVEGATVLPVFPLVGWRYPEIVHGALIGMAVPGLIGDLGITDGYIVLSVDGRNVVDPESFAKILEEEVTQLTDRGGVLRLNVQPSSGDPREFSRTFPAKPVAVEPTTGPRVHTIPRDEQPTGPINVWDRAGGNRGSGRDDPTQ